MRRFLRVFATAFLLLVIVMANVSDIAGPVGAEARTCESQSHRFKGVCISRTNCANICKTEGFPGGHCRGFRRRCFCVKHC